MARLIKILALAVLVVTLVSDPSKAEIDEPDRILEAVGPQVIKLRKCYEEYVPPHNSCSEISDLVKRALNSCSFDQIDLNVAMRKAAPKVRLETIERFLSEFRDRSRPRVEAAILKYRNDFPSACPMQSQMR